MAKYESVGTFIGNQCIPTMLAIYPTYIEASFDQFDVTTSRVTRSGIMSLHYYLDFILPDIIRSHLSP